MRFTEKEYCLLSEVIGFLVSKDEGRELAGKLLVLIEEAVKQKK